MKNYLLAGLALLAQTAFAQKLELPPASSSQKIEQSLGTSKITVNYARPSVKGRKIFGDFIAYGSVWRTGSNKTTDITFDKDVTVNGKPLKAGRYGLVTIPNQDRWTIIFSSQADSWGVYEYDASKDVLRFDVPAKKLNDRQETLLLAFDDVQTYSGKFQIRWDNTLVEFPITIDQDAEVAAAIDAAIARGEKVQLRSAIFYYNNGKDLKTAFGWVKEAENENKDKSFYWYYRGKIERDLGMKKEAQVSAKKGLEIAEKEKNQEYVNNNKALLDSLK